MHQIKQLLNKVAIIDAQLLKEKHKLIQQSLQKKLHVAVTTEFGPRYLHSTGQYNKGGPNTGVFIQFIGTNANDLQIPGQAYSFGLLKKAQAIGDMKALVENSRRVLLIDLGENFINGLDLFKQNIEQVEPILVAKNQEVKIEKFFDLKFLEIGAS